MRSPARLVIPTAGLLLAFLIYIRHDTVVRPYELGWLVWVFAIVATGFGLGWGFARVSRQGQPSPPADTE